MAVGAPPRICLPAGWMSLLDIQSLFLHLQVHKISITNGVKRTIKPTFGHLRFQWLFSCSSRDLKVNLNGCFSLILNHFEKCKN